MESVSRRRHLTREERENLPTLRSGGVTPYTPRVVDLAREQAPPPGHLRGCRDCRHRSGDLCAHPAVGNSVLNLFTGRMERTNLPRWKILRGDGGICGPEARMWAKRGPHQSHRLYGTLASVSTVGGIAWFILAPTLWALILAPIMVLSFFAWIHLGSDD